MNKIKGACTLVCKHKVLVGSLTLFIFISSHSANDVSIQRSRSALIW